MTTTVIVSAHCNPNNTEILVRRTNPEIMPVIENTLQDGETQEFYIYGDTILTVKEVPK